MSHFNYANLLDQAKIGFHKFRCGPPFPWMVFEGALHSASAQAALVAYPKPDAIKWFRYDNVFEKKLATNKLETLDPVLQQILLEMNQQPFLNFLEALTEIRGLVPDPGFNGGGLHCIEAHGYLHVHEDYNYHPVTNLDRRLNVILFLNKDWQAEYGGNLELWNATMTECQVSIPPLFNNLVVFKTDPHSYHGHPDPLKTPLGLCRKSLATYYYTNGRPTVDVRAPHSTLFQRRPGDAYVAEVEELRVKRGTRRLEDKLK